MSLKKAAIGILLLLAMFPGSCILNGAVPYYRAESICASVELGAPFRTVEEVVRRDGPPVQDYVSGSDATRIKPDSIEVAYWVLGSSSHWVCYFDFANGKLSSKQLVEFQ